MTYLLIGCPVDRRDWVIDRWMIAAAMSAHAGGVQHPEFVLVADPRDPTLDVAAKTAADLGVTLHVVDTHDPHLDPGAPPYKRDWWKPGRFNRMAEIRNLLLGFARRAGPDHLWSIDSDIIAAPGAYTAMAAALANGDTAAASCVHLAHRGTRVPNYGYLVQRPSERLDRGNRLDGNLAVHVLMANKLMSVDAYHVDYTADRQGEDAGWSKQVTANGGRLRWIAQPVSKHIYLPDELDRFDPRCGY